MNELVMIREGTLLRYGRSSDFPYIDALRKKEGSALGFLPRAIYDSSLERRSVANRKRYLYQDVMVTEDNSDLTGFCVVSYADSEVSKIFQIVVQADARRWHRALMMADWVEQESAQNGKKAVTCRVATDLESNLFWRAIGYIPMAEVKSTWLNQKESKSRRPLFVYRKPLQTGLFDRLVGEEKK